MDGRYSLAPVSVQSVGPGWWARVVGQGGSYGNCSIPVVGRVLSFSTGYRRRIRVLCILLYRVKPGRVKLVSCNPAQP